MRTNLIKTSLIVVLTALIVGCGSSARKEVPLTLYSDPLGAYGLLKVDYSDERDSDWVFLGSTPIKISKSIDFKKAKKVSLRIIREGFTDQTKTWSAKEFKKITKGETKILWSPALIKN